MGAICTMRRGISLPVPYKVGGIIAMLDAQKGHAPI